MSPDAILSELRGRGISITLRGSMLHLAPRDAVTAEIKEQVLAAKPVLLAHFEAEVRWRAEAMDTQARQAAPLGFWPVLVARPGPTPDGGCASCGEPLQAGERFRCALCLQAVGQVLATHNAKGSA